MGEEKEKMKTKKSAARLLRGILHKWNQVLDGEIQYGASSAATELNKRWTSWELVAAQSAVLLVAANVRTENASQTLANCYYFIFYFRKGFQFRKSNFLCNYAQIRTVLDYSFLNNVNRQAM